MLRNSLRRLLSWIGRLLLSLRYRVEVRGLEEVRARGTSRVVFLPSHLALIDPAILTVLLDRWFLPRALGDEYQISRPVVGWLARIYGVRALPNMERSGLSVMDATRQALAETIEGLRAGEDLLFYPAGRLRQGHLEEDPRRERRGHPGEGRAGGARGAGSADRPLGQQLQPGVRRQDAGPGLPSVARPEVPPVERRVLHAPPRRPDRVRRARRLPARPAADGHQSLPRDVLQRPRAAEHLRALRVLGTRRRARTAGPGGPSRRGRRGGSARGDAADRARRDGQADRPHRRPADRPAGAGPRPRQPRLGGAGDLDREGVRLLGRHAGEPDDGRRRRAGRVGEGDFGDRVAAQERQRRLDGRSRRLARSRSRRAPPSRRSFSSRRRAAPGRSSSRTRPAAR